MKSRHGFLFVATLIVAWSCATARAGALSELASQKDLNPEILIRSFAAFAFELSDQQQDAETFLQRKRGDCDDFANLANSLLTSRGYKTKLVMVMMEQQTHVVCYVEEARGFLDFNHRSDARPIVESDGSLEDIAQKVSHDFRAPWRTASEFKYKDKLPVYLDTVFPLTIASKPQARAVVATAQKVPGTNDLVMAPQPSFAAAHGDKTSGPGKSPAFSPTP